MSRPFTWLLGLCGACAGRTESGRSRPGRVRHAVIVIPAIVMVGLSCLAEQTIAKELELDIEAQRTDKALLELAESTGYQILFAIGIAEGHQSPDVRGQLDIDAALKALLADSGLEYELLSDELIIVKSAAAAGTPAGSAELPGLGNPQAKETLVTTSGRKTLVGKFAAAFIAIFAAPVGAQTDNAREGGIEEIVVTAQKREQSITDVPISITAFSGEDLEKFRIGKVEDVLLMTPGVQYVETSDFLRTVSIRGINDSLGGLFQTTGVTIDDATLIATYNGFLLTSRLFDIERIEVLRGPQGALTGSNSTSGTFNIITKKPKLDEIEGEATLDVSRFNTSLMRGIVNLPVSDTVAMRATAYVESSDGAVQNAGPGGGGSTEDHVGMRLATRWQPTDVLTLDASVNYEHQKYGAQNALPFKAPTYDDPENDDAYWAGFYRANHATLESLGGSLGQYEYLQDSGMDGGRIYSDLREKTEHDFWYGTLRGDYAMDRHSIMLMYTHYEHDVETIYDEDKSQFALLYSAWDGGPRTNYAEARITSDYGGAFNWVAGLSHLKERRILDLRYDATDAWDPAYFGGTIPDGDLTNLPYYPIYWSHTLEQIESTGLFANAFWDITDRLHLSAGGRVSKTETSTQSQFENSGNFGPFNEPVTADETHFDPRIALNYDLSEDVTMYTQYATGYRAGYGNTGSAVDLGIGPAEVSGESLANYEIGLKGRLFDGRATFSAAAFFMDYEDMQVYVSEPVSDAGPITEVEYDDNVQSAQSVGFEAEGSALLTDALIATLGVSYVDATIDTIEEEGVVYEDVPFPQVGPWTFDASLQYSRELAGGLTGNFLVSYSYRDDRPTWFPWLDFGPVGRIPAYNLVDLSFGVESEHWGVTAYINNVLDELYWQDTYLDYGLAGAMATFNAKTVGIRLTARL